MRDAHVVLTTKCDDGVVQAETQHNVVEDTNNVIATIRKAVTPPYLGRRSRASRGVIVAFIILRQHFFEVFSLSFAAKVVTGTTNTYIPVAYLLQY